MSFLRQAQHLAAAASAVPRLLGRVAEDFAATAPSALRGAQHRSPVSVAIQLSSALLSSGRKPPLSLDALGRQVKGATESFAGSGALASIDAANDIFSALGLQIWIVQPLSPDARVRVLIPPSHNSALNDDETQPNARRLTPKQFVRFMREAWKDTDLGCVEALVTQMQNEGRLHALPFLPSSFQQRLYTDIARLIVFTFHRGLLLLDDASLGGHRLKVMSTPTLSCGLGGAKRRYAGSEAQLRAIVDQLLASKAVKLPLLPRPLERRLYSNCLVIVFQLVDELLTGEGQEISFMGHRFRLALEPQPVDFIIRTFEDHPVTHCQVNEAALSELVEELLEDEETNFRWLPDTIESQMYLSVMRLLFRIAEHLISRVKLNVLGREVNMRILSHQDIRVRQEWLTERRTEATLYYEEQEPLRTVSTTELEERLKDLDEQRRVLLALQQLGSAQFDLTAERPMMEGEGWREPRGGPPAAAKGPQEAPAVPGSASSAAPRPEEGGHSDVHEFQRLAHSLKLARSLSVKCEVDADIEVPYSMIADLETYPLWMPWCTSGRVLPKPATGTDSSAPAGRDDSNSSAVEASFEGQVGFGFDTGTFLGTVGDTVHYRVSVKEPAGGGDGRVTADAVNGFTYGKRLVYDWRFRRVGPSRTKVELDMLFQARSVLYMPVWDSMQNMVVNNMLSAFIQRAEQLQVQRSRSSSTSL